MTGKQIAENLRQNKDKWRRHFRGCLDGCGMGHQFVITVRGSDGV